jgi:hypothetical protein
MCRVVVPAWCGDLLGSGADDALGYLLVELEEAP